MKMKDISYSALVFKSSRVYAFFIFGGNYMKKTIVIALLICLLVSLTACTTSFKDGFKDAGITSVLKEKDYEILGQVTMHSTVKNILCLFTFGGKGYEDFLEKAKEKYPECDAVINIYEDTDQSFILGIYNTFKHNYIGTAIKYI